MKFLFSLLAILTIKTSWSEELLRHPVAEIGLSQYRLYESIQPKIRKFGKKLRTCLILDRDVPVAAGGVGLEKDMGVRTIPEACRNTIPFLSYNKKSKEVYFQKESKKVICGKKERTALLFSKITLEENHCFFEKKVIIKNFTKTGNYKRDRKLTEKNTVIQYFFVVREEN